VATEVVNQTDPKFVRVTVYTLESFYDLFTYESLESFDEHSSRGSNHLAPGRGKESKGGMHFLEFVVAQNVEILSQQRGSS
jgi:hypothetical protein